MNLHQLYKDLGSPTLADIEGVKCIQGTFWFGGIGYKEWEWEIIVYIVKHMNEEGVA